MISVQITYVKEKVSNCFNHYGITYYIEYSTLAKFVKNMYIFIKFVVKLKTCYANSSKHVKYVR